MFQYQYVNLYPSQQIDMHAHPQWELSYIIKGSGVRTIGNSIEPFNAGEIVIISPQTPHRWKFEGCGKIANATLFFDEEFLSVCANAFAEFQPIVAHIRQIASGALVFDRAVSIEMAAIITAMQCEDDATRISLMLRLLPIIAKACDYSVIEYVATDAIRERMERIRAYVACNIQRGISLADIANHIGMNRSSFSIFFKRNVGTTFVDYLNRLRIEHVCQLLATSPLSIGEICYQSGFNDIPYFNRLFKKTMGMTPREYKHQQQES